MKTIVKISVAALAAYAFNQGAVQAQEAPAELVKAAKKEGALMFYAAITEDQVRLLAASFEKKYGIKSTYLRLVSGQLVQRFVTENDGKSNEADVFLDSSPVAFKMHADLFAPISAEKAPAAGAWPKKWTVGDRGITIQTSPMVVNYNTDLVKPNEVPKTWKELADPKWKGKALFTDPRTSETYTGWMDTVEKSLGPDYLKQVGALNFTLTPSGASGAQMIAAGAHAINFPTYASFAIPLKGKKAPIESRIMTNPVVVSQSTVGVAAHAKHPNVAQLFLNYLLSEEGIKVACHAFPVTTPKDFAGKLGCVPIEEPELMEYNLPEARKQALLQLLGLTSR
jgi:iron(III) transport system substrate-binding protein